MKHVEISPPFRGPDTHPYVAVVAVDPARVGSLMHLADDRPDVRLLGLDGRDPDRWLVFAACATRQGADMLETVW